MLDFIDPQASLLSHKGVKDNELWGTICDSSSDKGAVKIEYESNVTALKEWLSERLEWLSEHINAL